MDLFSPPLTLLSSRTLQPGISPIQNKTLLLNDGWIEGSSGCDDEVRSGQSDAVPRHDRGSYRGSGLTSDMSAVRIVAICYGSAAFRQGPGATASENNGGEIMIPRGRAPLRRRHPGGRHG